MAAVTAGILGAGMAAYQISNSIKEGKDKKRQLSEYEREELNNAFREIEISTKGRDLLLEENNKLSANLVDSARGGGVRGIVGAAGAIQAGMNDADMKAAKLIDDQIQQREYTIAQEESRIEGVREARDLANISGISSGINAARQDMWSGVMGMGSSLASIGRAAKGTGEDTDTEDPINPESKGRNPPTLGSAISQNLFPGGMKATSLKEDPFYEEMMRKYKTSQNPSI